MGELRVEAGDVVRQRFLSDVQEGLLTVAAISHVDSRKAESLLRQYGDRAPLRTLDALQLAVALKIRRRTNQLCFVAADTALCAVATLEGIQVVNPENAS